MNKRIIFCTDGTWNDVQSNTNVYKLFKALLTTSDQVAFYDDGVGADGTPLEKLAGGAMGEGIFQKIKDGYSKIAHVYEQGDEIFLFGFSRGAYTARSLAGMIAACGLPTQAFDDNLVIKAFQAYREKNQRAAILASLAQYGLFDSKIKMVGVWDTVGSLGIPALAGGVAPLLYGFLDTSLNPKVLNAYHALSIDERRLEFPPTLWDSVPAAGQVLEQVWFSGVHSDVGGGYPESGLSDVALSWMMNKGRQLGLQFADQVWAKYAMIDAQHALCQLHDSWAPLWGLPKPRTIPGNAALSNSVGIRCTMDANYRPNSLTQNGTALANTYQIVPVVAPPDPNLQPAAVPKTGYGAVALAVRRIVFTTATPAVMAQFGVNVPEAIPGYFNLGLPAPIGMTANRIMLMLPPLNALIQTSRSDNAANHSITGQQLTGTKSVADLVDLVWSKIQEP